MFGQAGDYVADIVPMRTGDYQWTFVGSLNGDTVNEKLDTADGKFNGVEGISELQFPSAANSTAQAATVGDVVSAIWVLDNSGRTPGIDEALDGGQNPPAGALGSVQHAQLVAGAMAWPTGLQDTAGQMTQQLTMLRTALENGDMSGAKGPAHEAHELGISSRVRRMPGWRVRRAW